MPKTERDEDVRAILTMAVIVAELRSERDSLREKLEHASRWHEETRQNYASELRTRDEEAEKLWQRMAAIARPEAGEFLPCCHWRGSGTPPGYCPHHGNQRGNRNPNHPNFADRPSEPRTHP